MEFRMGELFSGPGGLALAASCSRIPGMPEFKISHAWASDYDADTVSTYVKNIPGATLESVHLADVRELDLESLAPVDAFSFGFPCNDFSLVGSRQGLSGKFGPLFSFGINVLQIHQPKWFVAENVGGLRTDNDGESFKFILSQMTDAGYEVVPHYYKFEQYGVPQTRHRILIVGIRADQNVEFRVPSPGPFAKIDISARTALTTPPIAADATNNEFTNQSRNVIERLKHIEPGKNAFNSDIPEEFRLNVKGAHLSQIYRRLHPDKPSYTVTGSGGGGTHVYHWSEPRALTNRERARLQTFPDSFDFVGRKESVRKQIGMAVPPKGAQVIFESILKSFAGVEYESIAPNVSWKSRQSRNF